MEFRAPGTFKPITDMIGGGPFGLQPGEWTDDTATALCLAESLIEKHSFDPKDQMDPLLSVVEGGLPQQHGNLF